MITPCMELTTVLEARLWASEMIEASDSEIDALARYLWNNKPHIGCDWAQWFDSNPDFNRFDVIRNAKKED